MPRLRACGLSVFAILLPVLGLPVATQAQAAGATGVATTRVSVFAGGSFVQSGYDSSNNTGFSVGADVEKIFRHFDAGLEARYSNATGSVVDESSFCGGLKIAGKFGRLHPYADIEAGGGNITFDHPVITANGPYSHDNSFIYVFGGGLDVRLSNSFDVKLDVQDQVWKLGTEDNSFEPVLATIGLVYRIPFKRLPRRNP